MPSEQRPNRRSAVDGPLDAVNRRLLAELQADARLSLAELGRRVGLSAPAVGERLQTIADPRRQGENLKHPLVDVIIVGFCGVLAGCEDFVEIAEWGKGNEGFFRTFLALPHGIPSHDTFNRVFAMLQATPLQAVLLPWLGERRGLPGE